jgi:hypothetical protein
MQSLSFEAGNSILPTTREKIFEELEDVNLDIGQYWADISSPICKGNALVTFSIVEKGDIVDKGELMSVTNPLWVKTGDIVPIKAVFRNTGERYESAELKGTIKLADQIIKVIETDPLDVAPGETVTLETFFNPKMPGQYHINARVQYNNKLTFWKQSILNALESKAYEKRVRQQALKSWLQIGVIVIIIIILLLLILIKKKKKGKRKNKTVNFNF